jgi:hypothetical protein
VRIVLDESVPRLLARVFIGHEAMSVTRLGWAGLSNGELLHRAVAAGYTVLVTADRNLKHQQNIAKSGIAVIVLRARSNKLEDYLPLVPAVLEALPTLKPGDVVEIGSGTDMGGGDG